MAKHELVSVSVHASLIRNKTYKEEVHNDLWKEFLERVQMIACIPKYKEISITIEEVLWEPQ